MIESTSFPESCNCPSCEAKCVIWKAMTDQRYTYGCWNTTVDGCHYHTRRRIEYSCWNTTFDGTTDGCQYVATANSELVYQNFCNTDLCNKEPTDNVDLDKLCQNKGDRIRISFNLMMTIITFMYLANLVL